MLPIAYYLLKVIICSGILYGYYWLLLRNKIFHKYNRFYLMASVVLSLLLPLIKINFWQQNQTAPTGVIQVLQAVSTSDEYVDTVIITAKSSHFNTAELYPFAYLFVSLIFFSIFLYGLYAIYTLLKKYPRQIIGSISFINTDAKSTPFSFLKYIFWNSNIDIESITGQQIFKHELSHVQEKHSYDKLFINIILIFFWSNPFYWLLRRELNMIHEFIADKKAVEDSSTEAFAAMILQAAYPQHRFQLTNNFFYSPIKRRLFMLTKNKKNKVNYFGRIMVLPMLVLIFAAFTFKIKAGFNTETFSYNGEKITVVIDAAHGGTDLGSKTGTGIYEKNITLEIARIIQRLNTNSNIDIVLTRNQDASISLQEKIAFIKKYNADLFISLHIDNNAFFKNESGINFYVANSENPYFNTSTNLAQKLIDEFSVNYALPVSSSVKQRSAGMWILNGVEVPSVIIETGYFSNEKDARYLQTAAAKETIAKNILAAINKFKAANLQNADADNNILDNANFKDDIYSNTKHTDINYLNGNKLDDISDAKGKTALIDVSLKADDLPEVVVPVKIKTPLYIINGKESTKEDFDKIDKDQIEDIRVIKQPTALQVYGEKGRNGVIIINLKPSTSGPYSDKMVVIGDINNIGAKPYVEVDGKEYPGNSLPQFMKETGIEHFELMTLYTKEDAIKKFGNKATDGAIIATTKKIKNQAAHEVVIALDKMNMLYIGVDNPVSLAVSGYRSKDLIVSIQNGTITGKDGKYIARVSNINPAEIIIETIENGKRKLLGKQTYRVKRVPDPVDRIAYSDFDYTIKPILGIDGSNKVRLKAAAFLNAKKITAGTGYEVAEATVYFSGAGFSKVKSSTLNGNELSKLKENLGSCVAGSVITFDNVRVKGDNGYYSIVDGLSIQLY
jgi:N-acetylmuramoyl-L-alanine amidase